MNSFGLVSSYQNKLYETQKRWNNKNRLSMILKEYDTVLYKVSLYSS